VKGIHNKWPVHHFVAVKKMAIQNEAQSGVTIISIGYIMGCGVKIQRPRKRFKPKSGF
jgi:hypothetical protein